MAAAIIIIGLWSLIQSTLYALMSGASYAAHHCSLPMADSRVAHLLYVWYFQNSECGPVDWSLLVGRLVPEGSEPTMPDVNDVAIRMSIFSYAYFATSLLWLLSSIMLIAAECCHCSRRPMGLLWIISSLLVVLLDIGASGIFIWDITQSVPGAPFERHFQVTMPPNLPSLDLPPPLVALPSAIMLLISSRLLVFWVLNVVLLFVVWRLSKRASDNYPEPITAFSNEHNNNANHNYARSPKLEQPMQEIVHVSANYNNQQSEPHYTVNEMRIQSSRYDDQALHVGQDSSPPNYNRPYLTNPTELQSPRNYIEHRYFEPLKTDSSEELNQENQIENQRLTIDRPHIGSSSPSSRPVVPPKPVKPQRDQSTSPLDQRQSNQPPPDELRGQLPWSYFKSPSDITGPKRTFTQLREDEDLPPVPVPDYTLHFPRKDRQSTNSSPDDGSGAVWSGPDFLI